MGKVIVGSERGGGALEAGDFKRCSHEAGKTESGIFRGVFLEVGGFVGFVDNDEAEIFDRGKEGRAWPDDNLRRGRI